MGEDGLLSSVLGCCCGGPGLGEELYRDWDSHPACQQYRTLKRLGEGGFAEVHLAEDKLTGRTVALKVVFLNKAGLTRDQKKILAGEARLVRMVAHPHIVRCLQVLETRRQQVLVLEYLSGGEMLKQLQRMKRYSEANACQMFKQIVDAVAYLHSLGILHRDIKPENCLLAKPASHYAAKNKTVKVKLIDLGMAGLYRPKRPVQGCMGSPGFIAPEVILGEPHTPAMDVYSLGVLLFIMLVGRKPWDAQRSHTLAYAVQPTCEAAGLGDPVFAGLSAPAKQLLMWMLAEEPSRRPTAQQVLGHTWILQGCCCKAKGSSSKSATAAAPAAAGPQRVYQQVVQQRLQVLARSRDIMGSARGMMLLHGSGSRSQAVMFHRAVKAARLQLQQQAAALQAAGQLPAVQAAQGAASFTQQAQQDHHQQQQEARQTAATAAKAASNAGAAASSMPQSAQGAAACVVTQNSTVPSQAALSRCSAPLAAQGAASRGSSTGAATGTVGARALPRPASAADISLAAGVDDAASGEPAASRRQRSVTVGQLARQDLHRMQGVLFNALHQQQQQQPLHTQQQQQAGNKPHAGPSPGKGHPGRPGWHRSAMLEGGAALGGAGLAGVGRAGGSAMSAAGGAAAAGTGGSPSRPIAIDVGELQLDVLERGMSAPNAEMLPFSPPGVDKDAAGPRRLEWAVSVSPGALALLEADDQLCLLQAAGTSVDDGAALLAAGALSWSRRGAADMVASFKQHYPIKPVVRSIARFGQSLSRSLGRSIRSPRAVSMSGSGRYMDAAAAAIATETHSGLTSAQPSVTAAAGAAGGQVSAAAAAAAAAAPASPATTPAAPAAAAGQANATAAGPAPASQGAWLQANHTSAAAASSSAAGQSVPVLSANLQPPRCSHEGSLEQPGLLGANFSLDSNQAHVMWEMSMEMPFSPGSSLRCSDGGTGHVMDPTAHDEDHPQEQQQQQQHMQPLQLAQEQQHQHLHHHHGHHHHHTAPPDHHHHHQQHRLRSVRLAHLPPEQQRGPVQGTAQVAVVAAENALPGSKEESTAAAAASGVGAFRLSFATDLENSRVSASSAASSGSRPSAFATFGGFTAATAALDGTNDGSPVQHYSSSAGMLSTLHSPSMRAAATAAAARAEEEGIGLPNGLWLQQSQSINASAAAALQKLLSTASDVAAAAAAAGDADRLSVAGSTTLLPAASSRTLSGQLSPTRTQSGLVPAAEATSMGQGEDAAAAGITTGAAAAGNATAETCVGVPTSADVQDGPVVPSVNDSKDISMLSWLPGAHVLVAEAPAAAPAVVAVAPVGSDPSAVKQAGTVSSMGRPLETQAGAVETASSSRAVRVPRAVLGSSSANSRHRSQPVQPWRNAAEVVGSSSQGMQGDGSAVVSSSPQGTSATTTAPAVEGVGNDGNRASALENAPSAAASSVDQEFYVGSFWSPKGLAAQAGPRRQQQQQHMRAMPGTQVAGSMSSIGWPDSIQDSLHCWQLGTPSSTAELEDATLQSPCGQDPEPFGSVGRDGGCRTCSSSAGGVLGDGVRGVVRSSGTGEGEGLLEGCFPADSTGDCWEQAQHALQPGDTGAAVLVRVQSGLVNGEGDSGRRPDKAAAALSAASLLGHSTGSNVSRNKAQHGLNTPAALDAGTGAAPRPGNFNWIAKTVVGSAQQQQQPQFDAFDEPSGGEWYYAGS